jgi:hypothetical protein
MRLRSYDSLGSDDNSFSQIGRRQVIGRSSNVQNHVLQLHSSRVQLELFTELQALGSKNADAIGHALIVVAERAIEAMAAAGNVHDCSQVRIIHVVTGDGIGTNQAVVRRVAYRFLHQPIVVQAQAVGGGHIRLLHCMLIKHRNVFSFRGDSVAKPGK